MFKRSLASFAAVAVASGAVVAPANAMTLTVNDDTTCTIKVTEEEAGLIGLTPPANLSKEKAAHLKATLLDNQLPALGAEIEKDKQELDKPGLDEAKKAALKSALEEKQKRFTANNNLKKALEACIAGNNYDSNPSDDSKQPGGSDKPDDSKQPGGSDKPGDSKHPDGSNKPGGEHGLSSIDGAGIAAIVAVLGILAAALSFIKPLLPAQLRALLP
ncbi:TPA: hypothetical protein NBR61_001491 [Corynebacterium striatum]|uniref:hypothetical protein n=1 Tax=Corynebacterium striatum TaxID=43770 RepID=UPI001A35F566|nr:hypothetical protein [Corynebacterium striatum]MDK8826654.1 hypothetical protein [Corynebacterium striatum]HAT6481744.1 hypothetical protein [Corynebacterium striatum]HCD2523510.1 hypothetical protein [Corynebacterium striatum]HCD3162014.1 hypothetical protein [Corynebacterium striatum]HCD3684212.1 hypothetical protein [Corynebacterium striatum]